MAVRDFESCDFLLNNGADLRISRFFPCFPATFTSETISANLIDSTNNVPATITLEVASGSLADGATGPLTIQARGGSPLANIDAEGLIIPINMELTFSGGAVLLTTATTRVSSAGTFTITGTANGAAIAASETATYTQLVPVYSINQADSTINQNELEDRNFRSGIWITRRVTNRSASITASGVYVRKDPGLYLARDAAFNIHRVYFELQEGEEATQDTLDNGGDVGLKGWATLVDFQETRANDQHKQISFGLNVDGAPSYFDYS